MICCYLLLAGFIVAVILGLVFGKMAHDADVYDEQFRQKWEEEHGDR